MGTSYSVKLIDRNKQFSINELNAIVERKLKSINAVMSTYISDSEISRLNATPFGERFDISIEFCKILSDASQVSEQSNGAFDVTVGPLVNVWGFGAEKSPKPPSASEIDAILTRIGFEKLELNCDAGYIIKTTDLYVDLSAIAKGYASEVVALELIALGAGDVMVEIGGELTIAGVNAENMPWRIAIEKPSLAHTGATQVLSLSNVSVATSGEYRNYYEIDGERISHTIDPNTGRPIHHRLASVTVVTQSGALADAWATALNVLGENKGFELAQRSGLAAYFIVRNEDGFEVKYTDSFKQYMVN